MAKKLTFEQALEQLEQIVAEIEQGKVSLEDSIEKYAQGVRLIKQCRSIMDSAEKKIQLLAQGADGQVEIEGELDEPGESPEDLTG
jgi:exodeoxyribonuclease VII small subunit